MSTLLVSGCEAVVTMDDAGTELRGGSILAEDGVVRWVGVGRPPSGTPDDVEVLDGCGCVAIPGLVNTHHHLYQVLTRARAQDSNLFGWLTELYPVWAGLDGEWVRAAAAAGLAELALSGCTTSTDHHYVFPAGAGDLLAAEIEAAQAIGVRFHPCRGSMDLGVSAGGLPPDVVVQDADTVLRETEDAVHRFHDPAPGAMLRIAIAPCSPFSVTDALMRESVALARRLGVRLHSHVAETPDEEAFCLERFGCRPVELFDRLGFLGDDVWLAHTVHLSSQDIDRLRATGHTASDQVETILYRLASRGSPTGIAPRRSDGVVRPLLTLWRDETEAYCAAEGLAFQVDASNPETKRGLIRDEILPLLRRLHPAADENLLRALDVRETLPPALAELRARLSTSGWLNRRRLSSAPA